MTVPLTVKLLEDNEGQVTETAFITETAIALADSEFLTIRVVVAVDEDKSIRDVNDEN